MKLIKSLYLLTCTTLIFTSCSYGILGESSSEEVNSPSMPPPSSVQEHSTSTASSVNEEGYAYYEHPAITVEKIVPEKLSFRDRAMGDTTTIVNPDDIKAITDMMDQIRISAVIADESDYEYTKALYSMAYYAKVDDTEPAYTVNLSPPSVDIGSETGIAYKAVNFSEMGERLMKTIAKARDNRYK